MLRCNLMGSRVYSSSFFILLMMTVYSVLSGAQARPVLVAYVFAVLVACCKVSSW